MTEATNPSVDPRSQGEAFLASWDEMVTRVRLLETENRAMAEQVEALDTELGRTRERLQFLTAQRDVAVAADTASKNLLDELAQRLLAGMKAIRPASQLRGIPMRDGDPLPRVVQMGPRSA